MSYEGYTEYICPAGHYYTVDSMVGYGGYDYDYKTGRPTAAGALAIRNDLQCPSCHTFPPIYYHDVDVTNGYDEADPHTCDAPREMVSCFDRQVEDHRGNRYMVRDPRFGPAKGAEKVWLRYGSYATFEGSE